MDDELLDELERCVIHGYMSKSKRQLVRKLIVAYRVQKRRSETILGILDFKKLCRQARKVA